MKSFKTERRQERILSVLKHRQNDLNLVLENIHDPHNVSAILRTCDASGIPKISLVYNIESFPKLGKKSSASALKWVEKEKFKSIEDCYNRFHEQGFSIYASALDPEAVELYDLDFTGKTVIVMGNENRGLSEEAIKLADKKFYIPMYGMVQSLNVSVAAAITIYEALRQRKALGMYNVDENPSPQFISLLEEWNKK